MSMVEGGVDVAVKYLQWVGAHSPGLTWRRKAQELVGSPSICLCEAQPSNPMYLLGR